jgi:hypothetical protein
LIEPDVDRAAVEQIAVDADPYSPRPPAICAALGEADPTDVARVDIRVDLEVERVGRTGDEVVPVLVVELPLPRFCLWCVQPKTLYWRGR